MDQIRTKLFVHGALRGLMAQGQSACVLHSGDDSSGLVAVKVRLLSGEGSVIYRQERTDDEALGWFSVRQGDVMTEQDALSYLAKQQEIDPDLWVLEIDSRNKKNPLADF